MPQAYVNGALLHYESRGKGAPIVFIHPPLLTSTNFHYQLEDLSRSFRVIAFDIRGHGRSAATSEPLTYPLIVRDMIGLMDVLGVEKAYVAGYSTGGSIALEAMLSEPDRIAGSIIVSGMPEVSDMWLKTRIQMAARLTDRKAKKTMVSAIAMGNADRPSSFLRLYRDAMRGDVGHWEQYYRYSYIYNCTLRLHEIGHPVMLLFGERDRGFHRYARQLRSRIRNSRLYMLRNQPHQLPTKAAGTMNLLIEKWVEEVEKAEQHRSAEMLRDAALSGIYAARQSGADYAGLQS